MGKKLAGKNAAVTGASSGIGRATVLALAREGANVALIARNRERLEAVAEEEALPEEPQPVLQEEEKVAGGDTEVSIFLAQLTRRNF